MHNRERHLWKNAEAAVFVEKEDGRDAGEIPDGSIWLLPYHGCGDLMREIKEAADAESRYVLTCRNTDRLCIFHRERQASYG